MVAETGFKDKMQKYFKNYLTAGFSPWKLRKNNLFDFEE